MALKRMFSKLVISTDDFVDMPANSKVLYFYLMSEADDDGFVSNPRSIMRVIGASNDDMKILIAKQYVISFDSGLIVIKHWKIHNTIRKDTYKPTQHRLEKAMLSLEDGVYTTNPRNETVTEPLQTRNEPVTATLQNRTIDKNRLDKTRLDKNRLGDTDTAVSENPPPKKVRHKHGEYQNVLLTDEDMQKLQSEFPADWQERIERLSEYMASKGACYKNHLATIRAWARKEVKEAKPQQKHDSYYDNKVLGVEI